MANSKKDKKFLTEKIILDSKFMKDKNAGFLKSLGQITGFVAAIPIGISEAVAVNTYKAVKELNDSRKDKLNKNIRLGAEIKVRRELDNYDSPITDPNKIEELIAKEEVKLHAQKDKRLKMGLLSITGLSVLRSPIALYKTLTGEDIGEDGDDTDMEV